MGHSSWLQVRVRDGNSKEKRYDTPGYAWKKRKKGTVLEAIKKVVFDVPNERCQRRAWPYAERLPFYVVESQRRGASVIEPWSGWKPVTPWLQRGTGITQKLYLIPLKVRAEVHHYIRNCHDLRVINNSEQTIFTFADKTALYTRMCMYQWNSCISLAHKLEAGRQARVECSLARRQELARELEAVRAATFSLSGGR